MTHGYYTRTDGLMALVALAGALIMGWSDAKGQQPVDTPRVVSAKWIGENVTRDGIRIVLLAVPLDQKHYIVDVSKLSTEWWCPAEAILERKNRQVRVRFEGCEQDSEMVLYMIRKRRNP